VELHKRQGGSADHVNTTYSGTVMSSLVGKEISGKWSLVVSDALRGYQGTLNDWTLDLGYTATCPGTPAPSPTTPPPAVPAPATPLSDDFEAGLGKWTKSGQRGWTTSTSGAHGIPVAPDRTSSNKALHADACRYICHVSSRGFVDLSSAASATLTFKRFVDAVAVSVTARAATPAPAPAPDARSPCDASSSSSTCLYYTRYAEQCLGTSKPSRCATYATLITGPGAVVGSEYPAPVISVAYAAHLRGFDVPRHCSAYLAE